MLSQRRALRTTLRYQVHFVDLAVVAAVAAVAAAAEQRVAARYLSAETGLVGLHRYKSIPLPA